jgi:hypothetical protein
LRDLRIAANGIIKIIDLLKEEAEKQQEVKVKDKVEEYVQGEEYVQKLLVKFITHDEYRIIPLATLRAMFNYAYRGFNPGGFLTAVFTNDLINAVNRADANNIVALGAIVKLMYNELPADCWGNSAIVLSWVRKFLEERES